MKWLKLYHEARTDSKLDSLSDEEFRVWFRLLCYAGEQPERGVIRKTGRLLAAEVAKGDKKLLAQTLEALHELEIIQHQDGEIRFLNWEKRQSRKPSDSPERVAERVQRHRESKRGQTAEVVLHRKAPKGRAKLELIYQGVTHNRITDEDRADMDAMIELAGLETCIKVLSEYSERTQLKGQRTNRPYKFAYFVPSIRQAVGADLAGKQTRTSYKIADAPPDDWEQTG